MDCTALAGSAAECTALAGTAAPCQLQRHDCSRCHGRHADTDTGHSSRCAWTDPETDPCRGSWAAVAGRRVVGRAGCAAGGAVVVVVVGGPEMGNCYLKKKSITNYITNCFFTK